MTKIFYTFEDNLTWYKGNHTFTFGTHNEFYKFANLFIQDANGTYNFADLAHFNKYYEDFMAGTLDPTMLILSNIVLEWLILK